MSKVRTRLGLKFTEKPLHPKLLLCNIYNYSPKSLCSSDSYHFWSAYQSILLQYLFRCTRISPSSSAFHHCKAKAALQWIKPNTAAPLKVQKRWYWENVTRLGKLVGTKFLFKKGLKYIGCSRIWFTACKWDPTGLNVVTDGWLSVL